MREYIVLILLAVLLSTPVCVWLLTLWLETFEYKMFLSPWTFLTVGVGMLATAILITSYHVLKAASMNPALVLKDE